MNLSTIKWGATKMQEIPLTHSIGKRMISTMNITEGSMQPTTVTPLKMAIEHLLGPLQIMMGMNLHQRIAARTQGHRDITLQTATGHVPIVVSH